jgi:uncharacterized protein YukJ
MPRKPGVKFGRRSTHGPDTQDIDGLVSAFLREYGVAPKWEIDVTPTNNLRVICDVMAVNVDKDVRYYTDARLCNPFTEDLLALMLQTAHSVYHQMDRDPFLWKLGS